METDDVHREDADGRLMTVESDGFAPEITSVRTSPERLLFSEQDNPDGWIATDLAVDLER